MKATQKRLGRWRAHAEVLTGETAEELRDLCRAAAAGGGLRLYCCVYP